MTGGPIHWFVHNPIAANLLMVLLVVGGWLAIPALNKQFFPEFEINIVSVSVPYPGAGPSEVEEQICVRVEEAVHDLAGIKEIRSTAQQGVGTVLIEAEPGYDTQRLTAEVKNRVDAINTFPGDVERPIVSEVAFRHLMAVVTIFGDIGERQLKELGETLRDDLSAQPHVSVVEIEVPRPYELSVEVSEFDLRRYGLTFDEVVAAIRSSSLNLPAGNIKTAEGDIQVQTRGQAYEGLDFEQIPLLSDTDGTQVTLGEVATIIDGFEDMDIRTRFDDSPSHDLNVYVTSNPDTLATSAVVTKWVEDIKPRLPPGVEVVLWQDTSVPFKGRVETLVKNGLGGLLLVFLVLVLFLRPLLAMWVCVGIAVAFMGTFFALQFTGFSLNMISLFAFLLVLGIIVDDAIIVGEAIHSKQSFGEAGAKGAIDGARLVLKPVMFAVISTMIFFSAMFFLPGDMARAAFSIPVVVILALTFSLVECLWILPSHLAHMRPVTPSRYAWVESLERTRLRFANGMTHFAHHRYRRFLERCLKANFLVIAIFFVALLLSISIFEGGWVRTAFLPVIADDYVEIEVSLREGGAYEETLRVLDQIEGAAVALKREYNESVEDDSGPLIGHIDARARGNEARVIVETLSDTVDVGVLGERWREMVGDLGDVEQFELDYTINERGKPISLLLTASSVATLRSVADELRAALLTYPGVFNVNDSFDMPNEEIVLDVKPAAENLSVTLADLALQVRQAFYGAEAQRIPRAREDVRVMVRYPEEERISIDSLNEMRVRTPTGAEVPFDTVADLSFAEGYLTIDRLDRKRVMSVTAELSAIAAEPREIVEDLLSKRLTDWQTRYPDLNIRLDGELEEEEAFLNAMLRSMGMAMLIIYALMAIPFRSYFQPLLVLTAVPFGFMGAIFGHMIMGLEVSMFSLMGVLACAGVVVNDNLVLIDRINQLRAAGHSLMGSLLQAGEDRFRPIILTSLTTFVGLLPIMSETSVQAQFLIPMVTSLAFGVLFATGITLLLVPCLYLFGEQFSAFWLARKQAPGDAAKEV
ncbi:MAG: efflux RND transporter permease subunit [Pseudomonadota bacterium]